MMKQQENFTQYKNIPDNQKVIIHFYHPRLISRTLQFKNDDMLFECRNFISRGTFLDLFQNYVLQYNKKTVKQMVTIAQALGIDQNTKDRTFTLQIKLTPFDERTSKHHLKEVVQILYNPILYQLYQVYSIQQKKLLAQEVHERTLNLKSAVLMPKQNYQLSSNIYNILDYNVANQLILPHLRTQKPQLIHFISFSGYNPPPISQRLDGSLYYLHLRVLESVDYHITACPQGFYLNQSKISYFNPSPVPGKPTFVNLLDLIKNLSQKFQIKLQQFITQNQLDETDKIFMGTNKLPVNSWLQKCEYDHSWNSKKSMNYYLKESFDTRHNDWNQSFHLYDQVFMSGKVDGIAKYQAQKKLYQQFEQAALEGATMIVDGKLAPLNPLQQKKKQIYIYNRIFFSQAAQTTYNHAQQKGEEAAPSASAINTDLINMTVLYNLQIPDVNVLHMIIVNYRGFRIIAQSIIPGILSSDQHLCSQYGSIDDGKTLQTNPQFEKLMIQIAQKLNLDDNIHLLDGNGCKKRIAISPDIKGILGSNSKKYILDLLRLSPRDLNYPEIQDQACVLRHQLIEEFTKVKLVNQSQKQKFPRINVNIGTQIKYIPNQLTQKQQKSLQQMASFIYTNAIPNLINSLKNNGSEFLTNCEGISKVFHLHGVNLRYLGVLHEHSQLNDFLNIKIVLQRVILTKSLKHLFRAVMRQTNIMHMNTALTHLLNCIFGKTVHINQLENGNLKQAQEDFSKQNKKKKKKVNKMKQINTNAIDFNNLTQTQNLIKVQPSIYISMKPNQLWDIVVKIAQARYKHKLCDNLIQFNQKGLFSLPYTKLATLQDLCNVIGLTLQQKHYPIVDDEVVQGNINKNNYSVITSVNFQNLLTNHNSLSTVSISLPFTVKNIAGINASSKKMQLKLPNQQNLMKLAQQQTQKFKIKEALDHFSDLVQIYTITNNIEGLCQIYTKTGKIFYMMTQYQTALNRQLISLKLFENGLRKNSYKVIQSYSKLGLYEMVLGNRSHALYFLNKSLFLMLVNFGQTYPDILVTIANIARIYQQDKEVENAQKYYQKAIQILKPSHAKYHINISFCYSCLASLHYQSTDFKKAIQYQSQAVGVLCQILSQQDTRLIDAKKILKVYMQMGQKGKVYTPQQIPVPVNTKQKQKSDRFKK